jgi:hypothetical protein
MEASRQEDSDAIGKGVGVRAVHPRWQLSQTHRQPGGRSVWIDRHQRPISTNAGLN